MSAGFTAAESVAFTGCSCAPCWAEAAAAGAAGALCGCAAMAEESRGLSRMAVTPNRTDERRKVPPGNLPPWMLSRTEPPRQLLPVISPLFNAGARSAKHRDTLDRAQGRLLSTEEIPSGLDWWTGRLGTRYWVLGTVPLSLRKLFLFLSLNFPLPPVLILSATI